MHELDRIIEAAKRAERGFIATVVRTEVSTYRRAGARCLIDQDGNVTGTISGGCLERDLALRAFATPCVVTYDSSRDDDIVFGLGLGCRGVIDIHVEPFDRSHPPRLVREFAWNGREPVVWTTSIDERPLLIEMVRPQRSIAIYGGGPDVDPLATLAETVGWRATIVRPRDVHPEQVSAPSDVDAVVIMTHNYLYDLALLRTMVASNLAYIGLLGPRARGDELLAQIEGTSRDRIHNPIGLDLGGETPEEIALAIVAEIEAVLNRRDAKSLRDVEGPLHVRSNVPCR